MTPAYLLPPLDGQYAAFLRTIAAAPDDDTPRLVLADWLEEYDAPERAEFIRAQCELAAHGRLAFDPNWKAARGLREAELRLWHGVSGHFPVVGYNPVYNGLAPEYSTSAGTFTVRRGFIDTVRGPLAALLGDGRTPGALGRMGPELLAVRRADASDREPWVNLDRTHWGWWERNDYHDDDGSLLDRDLMLAMAADPTRGDWNIGIRFTEDSPPGGFILFRTEAAARDALSRAVLTLARRRAGLEQPKRRN